MRHLTIPNSTAKDSPPTPSGSPSRRPGLPGGEARLLEDAGGLPWVMEPHGAASRHWAEQACRQAGFEPDVRYETADLQAQIRLIESGNAVAFLPDLVWSGRGTSCRMLDLPDHPRRTVFTSARRASANRPAILALREVLEETARQSAPGAISPRRSPGLYLGAGAPPSPPSKPPARLLRPPAAARLLGGAPAATKRARGDPAYPAGQPRRSRLLRLPWTVA